MQLFFLYFLRENLLGLSLFPGWPIVMGCYVIPPVEFVIELLPENFATAQIMWWYVLIFESLGELNFADRYSLDRIKKQPDSQRYLLMDVYVPAPVRS